MKKRARQWGLRFGKYPTGRFNAITDVKGVLVGHETIIEGTPGGKLARTGVTVVLPNDDIYRKKVFAGGHVINGAGEMSGMYQINEWGIMETPLALTSSMNVGIVHDGIVDHVYRRFPEIRETRNVVLPVVAECNDGILNDPYYRHVRQRHVRAALERAASGPVAEGSVGGGTGMVCCSYKSGIGTASRRLPWNYRLGVLVMSNFGNKEDLRIDGIPVGRHLREAGTTEHVEGSIIVVIATDAPLLPHQLVRLSKRAAFGIARAGSFAENGSGEIVLAFSTAKTIRDMALTGGIIKKEHQVRHIQMLKNEALNPLFEAVVEAVEEAIVNALFSAEDMTGRKGTVKALPVPETIEIMERMGYFKTPDPPPDPSRGGKGPR